MTNAGVNKVFLLGRIDQDAIWNNQNIDGKYLQFSLITTDVFRKKLGVEIEHSEVHLIRIPNRLITSQASMMLKGVLLHLEGSLETQAYFDEEGIRRYATNIIVNHFEVIS